MLVRLGECYSSAKRSDFVDFLNSSVRPNLSKDDGLYATTLELENFFLIRDGKYDKAIVNFDTLASQFAADTATVKHALFDLWSLYFHELKDTLKANECLAELKAKYPKDDLTWHAMLLAGEINGNPSLRWTQKDAQHTKIIAPTNTELFANYPNPFNPTTIISYQLSVNSQVSLRVYDILGREVVTLANGMKEAGYYTTSFNGAKLPSGIYFTRFVVRPQGGKPIVQVKKMILMK